MSNDLPTIDKLSDQELIEELEQLSRYARELLKQSLIAGRRLHEAQEEQKLASQELAAARIRVDEKEKRLMNTNANYSRNQASIDRVLIEQIRREEAKNDKTISE